MLKVIKELKKQISFYRLVILLSLFVLFLSPFLLKNEIVDASAGQRVFRVTEEEKKELQEMVADILEKTERVMELVAQQEKEREHTLIKTIPVASPVEDYYVSGAIFYGKNNDPEAVKEIQRFLNDYEGENLPITGFYGELTLEAVKRFQEKYAEAILHPWGITQPTGVVHTTTRNKMNSIKAGSTVVTQETVVIRETEEESIEEEEVIWGVPGEELVAEEQIFGKEERGKLLEWILVVIGVLGIIIVVYNIRYFKETDSSFTTK